MGKKKYIATPEIMWEHFCKYREELKSKPIVKMDFKGKDATKVFYEIERPLTLDGFENWCSDNGIIENLDNYFANSNDAYSEYSSICSRIRKVIRQDQIEGGMSGIYNASITQRLNGLTDNTSTTVIVEQPLFGD